MKLLKDGRCFPNALSCGTPVAAKHAQHDLDILLHQDSSNQVAIEDTTLSMHSRSSSSSSMQSRSSSSSCSEKEKCSDSSKGWQSRSTMFWMINTRSTRAGDYSSNTPCELSIPRVGSNCSSMNGTLGPGGKAGAQGRRVGGRGGGGLPRKRGAGPRYINQVHIICCCLDLHSSCSNSIPKGCRGSRGREGVWGFGFEGLARLGTSEEVGTPERSQPGGPAGAGGVTTGACPWGPLGLRHQHKLWSGEMSNPKRGLAKRGRNSKGFWTAGP